MNHLEATIATDTIIDEYRTYKDVCFVPSQVEAARVAIEYDSYYNDGEMDDLWSDDAPCPASNDLPDYM